MILVTGASGFIGANVAARLIRQGQEAVLLRRRGGAIPGLPVSDRVHHVAFDLRERAGLADVLDAYSVDTVLHLATGGWSRSVSTVVHDSVGTLANLLDAARAVGLRRLVVGSSISVFGAEAPGPFREVRSAGPDGANGPGVFKAWEEQLALSYSGRSVEAVIARMPMVYGPRYHSMINLPSRICAAVAGDTELTVNAAPAYADFAHVNDVSRGLVDLCLADTLQSSWYHLGSGSPIGRTELVAAARSIGAAPSVVDAIAGLPAWDASRHLDNTASRTDFGFTPTIDIATGLEKYLDWMRADENERQTT